MAGGCCTALRGADSAEGGGSLVACEQVGLATVLPGLETRGCFVVLNASTTQVCGQAQIVGGFASCAGWLHSPLSASDSLHATEQQVNPGELAALSKGREVAPCECGWA